MRQLAAIVVLFIFTLCFNSLGFAVDVWEPVSGIKEADIKEIAIDDRNPGVIYVASEKTVYKTEGSGKTWKRVFFVRGEDNSINFIDVSGQGVYACTENGLFTSSDGAHRWKRIFEGVGEEDSVLHIAFSEDGIIYLGTKGGLFVSNDNGATWHKDSDEAGSMAIKWIYVSGDNVLIASEQGVYKNSDSGWERVFVSLTEETEYDADSADEAITAIKPVNSIATKEDRIFLATDSGIFVSDNYGKSWERFTSDGLLSQKVNRLVSKNVLYAATEKGIFRFLDNSNNWKALYKGMDARETYSISIDENNILWAATNNGLYKVEIGDGALFEEINNFSSKDKDILRLFDHEPSIKDVQNKAIEYAEVHPEKIQQWRKKARINALLPELSVDYDKTVNYYGSTDRYTVGPYDWGVTAKWDLGDLIWNPSQTSIDTRSKLMVQTIPSCVHGLSL